MAKPLDLCSQAIADNIREVLASHGLCITALADTQFPKLGADLDKVLHECAHNSMRAVLLVQESDRVCSVCGQADAGHTCCPPTEACA